METITTTDALADICPNLAKPGWFTIDTEFMRDRTYWSKLCLIQVASDGVQAIIDPLADGLNLAPLYDLLADTSVVKVFHAGRQDIEIFFHMGGVMPSPIFDTQVAAMVLGYGDSISYDALCRKVAGQQIDKSSRFTDWARRPLSARQLDYALADVTHLRDIYAALKADMEAQKRGGWVEQELAVLTSPATYNQNPADAWGRVKAKPKSKRALAVLIELAAWREREAQKADVPRARIMKDEALTEIATNAPKNAADLGMLRALPRGFERSRAAAGLLEAVAAGRKRDLATLPALPSREPVPQRLEPVIDLLKVVLRLRARQQKVAQRLLATTDDIERIALDDHADVPGLKGWRREIFGEMALDVKHGRRAIVVKDGEVRLVKQDQDDTTETAK
ncbi:Ribonuclease D [hydrothermal vent metagenome]|uniref:Ribonuclease D n=1 Tax=hydrothermal vent metagenome TaxID=652676 RepID=A0A3B0T9J9_9ZZZZ